MKTLIVYYSYTGVTAKMAKELAKKRGADLFEVRDIERPNVLKAYTAGCVAAIKWKSWPVEALPQNMEEYDLITIMAPVWAGNPAPEINNAFEALPRGKKIEVIMVSTSGKSGCEQKIKEILNKKGCVLVRFRNVREKLAKQLDS